MRNVTLGGKKALITPSVTLNSFQGPWHNAPASTRYAGIAPWMLKHVRHDDGEMESAE